MMLIIENYFVFKFKLIFCNSDLKKKGKLIKCSFSLIFNIKYQELLSGTS